MDSTPALAMPPPVLVLRTGRLHGTHRALKGPITFIGSQPGCDIQLTVESVLPVHCVVAAGPDGPIARAWNDADVQVNGLPVRVRSLRDGDILQIGPFEFEILVPAPLALPVNVEPDRNGTTRAASAQERPEKLHDLHRQLSEARANFRRERKEQQRDITRRLRQLAETRDAVVKKEAAVQREQSRLLQLRKRFIHRWKKQWSAQRHQIQQESIRLQRERADLDTRQAAFAKENERARAHTEVERHRIEAGRQQLREATRVFKEEQSRQQAILDAQRRAVEESGRCMQAERATLQDVRMRAEQHVAQLRIEADGLESRIVNLRAVLLQLEAERKPQSIPTTEAIEHSEIPQEPAVEERLADLERLIAEVSDQRQILLEQTDRLGEARIAWREEETRLVGEMEQLGERLRICEDRLIERDQDAYFEHEALDRDRSNLEQLRDRLDAWQARLEASEQGLREETLRLEVEIHQRARRLERREIAFSDLSRRWSERRRTEVQQLRAEHRRMMKLRMGWERQDAAMMQLKRSILQQRGALAAQALVLERARLNFLVSVHDPRVATTKMERWQRHLKRANARQDELLEQKRQTLNTERKELLALFEQTGKRVEQFADMEREIADRLNEVERREYRLTDREIALAELESVWKTQRESYERERTEFRDDIDRLAGLLIEARTAEPVPLARAA